MFQSAWSIAVVTALLAAPAAAQTPLWTRQLGTSQSDSALAAAPDGADGLYIAGITLGSLGGMNAGFQDPWLARYDDSGNQLWIRQFGTDGSVEQAEALAPDGAGGVYVAGTTNGSLGGPQLGQGDVWLARYDAVGNQTWIIQFGTSGGEGVSALARDGDDGVFVVGEANSDIGGPNAGGLDVWLARYDGAGNRVWILQFGTSEVDLPYSAATDGAGGVYAAGSTTGSLGGQNAGSNDAWLARYDDAGNQLWIRQLGTAAGDRAHALAPAPGGAFVAGYTIGSLAEQNAGATDAWVARYDGAGNQAWIHQFGTTANDTPSAAAPDGAGGVYVAGWTDGSLGGPSAGGRDAWLADYDGAGNQIWSDQLGSTTDDYVSGAAPDESGGVYVAGSTTGSLGGQNVGARDAWLAHYGAPCPGDISGDRAVDLQDLATLLAHFGTASGATYADGDLDVDGDVDLGDLSVLLSNFGSTCP